MILVSITLRPIQPRVAGSLVGLGFGLAAIAANLAFGAGSDLTRGLGWLVLLLAPILGFVFAPEALKSGWRNGVRAAFAATLVALPVGALLYAFVLELTSGFTGPDLVVGALASAVFGLLVGAIPIGPPAFAAAILAIALLRVVFRGPSVLRSRSRARNRHPGTSPAARARLHDHHG